MNKRILLIGGGGHCKSVLDTLLDLNEFDEIGIIDTEENIGSLVMGIPVVGCDDDLHDKYSKGYQYAFVTLGSIGNPIHRMELFRLVCKIGFKIPTIIDLSANVSKHVQIGKGVFIGKNAIVNAGTVINKGAIINSGAIVEHDCHIGEFVHIAPGAVLSGNVVVGDWSHVGTNATIKQQVNIGSNSMVGMGSVVISDVLDHVVAYGNPCKAVKEQ